MLCGRRVPVLLLLLAGCVVPDSYTLDEPPAGPPGRVQRWWDEYVDGCSPAHLAVLLEASEVHRQNGKAATYCWRSSGRTMFNVHVSESRLPLPLPPAVAEQVRCRLAACERRELYADDPLHPWSPLTVSGATGCSAEEALAVWKRAARKWSRRDEPDAPAAGED